MDNANDIDAGHLGELLRRDKSVKEAEVMAGPGSAITVVVVQQGVRSGPILRRRVMQMADGAASRLQLLLVRAIPRRADGSLDTDEVLARIADAYRFEPPGGDTERHLAELVDRVLPGQQISMTDRLGDLGADSLTTFELAALISERFGADISPYQLFRADSLKEMAALIEAGPVAPQ